MCVLGYNVNRGQEVALRLRTDDWRGLRKYARIRETLIHELAHMVRGGHVAMGQGDMWGVGGSLPGLPCLHPCPNTFPPTPASCLMPIKAIITSGCAHPNCALPAPRF